MNKKKRALALGLAATQLSALSAIVAPLTAMAATEAGNVTVVTSGQFKDGQGTVIDKYGENGQKYVTVSGSKISVDVAGMKAAATEANQNARATFGLEVDLSSLSLAVPTANVTEDAHADAAVDAGSKVYYGIAYDPKTSKGALAPTKEDWTGYNDKDSNALYYGDVIFNITCDNNSTQTSGTSNWFGTGDTVNSVKSMKLYLKPTDVEKIIEENEGSATFQLIKIDDGAASIAATKTLTFEYRTTEVAVAKSASATLDAVTGEDEAAVIAAAKEKITAKLADETTPLLEFKETASGNAPVTLTYNTDYEVTFDEGAFTDTTSPADSVKDTVTFNLTVKLTADGLKKVNFGDKTAPGTGKEDTKTVEVTVTGKAVSPVSWETDTASLTGSDNATITVKKGGTALAAADKVKEGDVLTVEVAAKEGFQFKTAPTGTASKTGATADTLSFTKDAASEKYSATVTVGAQTAGTPFTIAFTAGKVEAIPTATIKPVTTGLTGAANATIELFKSDGTTALGTTALKNGEKFKVKITPKAGYEFLTANAPKYQLTGAASATALTKNGDAYEAEIEITGLTTAGNTALTLTLTGEVTKKPVVEVLEVVKGVQNAAGMNGTYGNYNDNLDKYTPTLTTDSDGNYVITVDAQYGAMKGTAAAGGGGKNVLLLLKMQENIDTKVLQESSGSWTEDNDAAGNASTFLVTNAADADQDTLYKPLWVSLTDARLADGFEGVKFKLKSGTAEKIVTVKFTDTTEYSVTGSLTETDYTASATVSADKQTATITVSPADGKILTAASIKLGDSTTVALKPSGKNYVGEFEIKTLLTPTEIENGTVTKTLASGDFTVTASTPSTIKVAEVSLATKESDSLDAAGLASYQHNRDLITNITWDDTNNITTVEVPSALLKGSDVTTPGTSAANICLLMKFQNKLTKDDSAGSDKWGVEDSKILDVDIEDGWKFAEGATEADKGLYAVLWINASEAALDDQGGNKVVIYDDKDGKVITTVSLVKVEAIKPSEVNTGISAVNLTAGDTEADKKADIVAAVEAKLADKAELVNIEVTGTIPAEGDAAQNNVNVEVTITAKSGAKVVLADADNKAAADIVFNVPVNVPAVTKYTVTVPAAAADGTVNADKANAAAGTKVTLTVTPASGKELGTLTIKDGANEDVEYTEEANGTYTFTMPASNVTITATFVAETQKYNVNVTAPSNGTVTVTPTGKVAAGTAVTIAATPASGYKVGDITVKQGSTAVKVTNNKFTMPAGDVTVTVTFTKKSSGGGSSSGGGHSGGGHSSGGSSGGTSSTILSDINSSSKGDTVEAPYGTTALLSSMLEDAADKEVTLSVPVNSTYTWTIDAKEMESTDSSIILSVTEAAVSKGEVAKVEGKPITDTMGFSTKAKNLGKSATLTVSTPARPTAAQPKFANLYKIKSDGTLEFVDVVPVDDKGKAVLPISDAGSYSILISDETKKIGDVNNDCKVDLADLSRCLRMWVDSADGITRKDNFKVDYDNSGMGDLKDVSKMLADWVNNKLS